MAQVGYQHVNNLASEIKNEITDNQIKILILMKYFNEPNDDFDKDVKKKEQNFLLLTQLLNYQSKQIL